MIFWIFIYNYIFFIFWLETPSIRLYVLKSFKICELCSDLNEQLPKNRMQCFTTISHEALHTSHILFIIKYYLISVRIFFEVIKAWKVILVTFAFIDIIVIRLSD